MWKDPIVDEVRMAGAKLAEECGYDLHVFANMLRQNQKESGWLIASADYLKKKNKNREKLANS